MVSSLFSRPVLGWLLVGTLSVCAPSHPAGATIVISDTFTGPNNTALLARLASPIDLPGNGYEGNGNVSSIGGPTGGTPYEADIQSNMARLGADAGVGINLASGTPTVIQLSITFNISGQTETQASNIHRGAGLGFFSSVAVGSGGSFHSFNNFTGLAVDRAGSVRLIVAGADSGIFTTVGGFNPAVNHTLSYDVSTYAGVGTIANILLDGSSLSLTAPVNTFTVARTAYAGFYNSAGPATELADFDNFLVATVPEPRTIGIVCTFAVVSLLLEWRARRRSNPANGFDAPA